MLRKKIIFWFMYCCYVILILVMADYIFYLFYVIRIIPKDMPAQVSSTIEDLPREKITSVINFREDKNDGVIRIGCFGDSFTHGDEVNNIYDYPSSLQKIFKEKGYDHIEVINFGRQAAGFHYAFNVWKFLGKEYNLDYIILGPACFQYERDSTFSLGANWSIKDALRNMHARYILNDEGVKLINVIGETPEARIAHYLRFIPHIQYLKYDIRPPSFLTAPLYCLAPNRELRNPFYYKTNLTQEMSDIYRILIGEMAADGPQVILCHYNKDIVEIGQSLKMANIVSFVIEENIGFPYKAPGGHNGSNGNEFLARLLFDCMTNKIESIQAVIKTETIPQETIRIKQKSIQKIRLSEFKDIAIEVNAVKLGRFCDPKDWDKYCIGPLCASGINTFSNTTSIVAFQNESLGILDWAWLTLDFELEENTPLVMRLRSGGKDKDICLGDVRSLYPGLNVGIVHIGCASYDFCNKVLKVRKNLFKKYNICLDKAENVNILLGNTPVLSAKIKAGNDELIFYPLQGRLLLIKADGRKILDMEKLPSTGFIYLVFDSGRQESYIRIPLARWIKMDKKISFGQRIMHPITPNKTRR